MAYTAGEKTVPHLAEEWKALLRKINKFRRDIGKPRSSLSFSFVEVCVIITSTACDRCMY